MGEVAGGRREGGLGGRTRGGDQGWGRWGWVAATGLGAPGARTGEPQGTSFPSHQARRPPHPHLLGQEGRGGPGQLVGHLLHLPVGLDGGEGLVVGGRQAGAGGGTPGSGA